jgi:hypothetical protein
LTGTIVTAVGLCLAALGILGATLATGQLIAWGLFRGVPVVADVWTHSGLTGDLFVYFFEWLPLWLVLGAAFHAFVGLLGISLWRRRPWARTGAIAFAWAWGVVALLGWAVVWFALDDLQGGYPERAAFAQAVKGLAAQVALINVGLSAGLILLMIQPAVRAQFEKRGRSPFSN